MISVTYADSTDATGGTCDSSYDEEYSPSTAAIYYYISNEYEHYDDPEIFIAQHYYNHHLTREKQEQFYKVLLMSIFNIYKHQHVLRQMFSKSGFCGRVAKRRKGK